MSVSHPYSHLTSNQRNPTAYQFSITSLTINYKGLHSRNIYQIIPISRAHFHVPGYVWTGSFPAYGCSLTTRMLPTITPEPSGSEGSPTNTPQPRPTMTLPSDLPAGEIAFYSKRNGNGDIYVMRLTENFGLDHSFQWTDNRVEDDHPLWMPKY